MNLSVAFLMLAAASGRVDYAAAERDAEASLAGRPPFAHALRAPSFHEWTRLDFATAWRGKDAETPTPHLVVRRTIGGLARPRTDYAEADACPGLAAAILEIETLPAVPIDVPGLGLYEPPSGEIIVTGDGTGYRVWGSRTRNVYSDEEGGARWMERVLSLAATCWRPQPPSP